MASPANNIYSEDNNMSDIFNTYEENIDDRSNGPRPETDYSTIKAEAKAAKAEYEASKEDIKAAKAEAKADKPELTMEWVLTRFDKIMNDTEYFDEAINRISLLKPSITGANDSIINGIRNTVKAREETNRQLLSMLSMMYAQLNANNPPPAWHAAPLTTVPAMPNINKIVEEAISKAQAGLSKAGAAFAKESQNDTSSFSTMINAIRDIEWDGLPDEIREAITEAIESKRLKPDKLKKMMDEIKSVDWDEVPDEVREAVAESFRSSIM
jgi:hypothetical protein